jgi:hypothetical protein
VRHLRAETRLDAESGFDRAGGNLQNQC